MLETDLIEIMKAIENETLSQLEIRWKDGACACVVMASGGYPQKYETGKLISGLDENGQLPGVTVYHAGTKKDADGYKTAGGRVLGVTACGRDLEEALQKAYAGVHQISFDKAHYRKDIGRR